MVDVDVVANESHPVFLRGISCTCTQSKNVNCIRNDFIPMPMRFVNSQHPQSMAMANRDIVLIRCCRRKRCLSSLSYPNPSSEFRRDTPLSLYFTLYFWSIGDVG